MTRTSLIARAAAALLLAGLAASAPAKDVKLGGKQENPLPSNVIALPTIAVMIRTNDGGWKHIKVDAWVAGINEDETKRLDSLKTAIVAKSDRELPNRNFEILQSAGEGTAEVKKVIRAAVEDGLGHEWKGNVYIRNMMVY